MPELISRMLALGRRGVALLDDARDLAVYADDASVAVRAFDHRGDDRGGRAGRGVRVRAAVSSVRPVSGGTSPDSRIDGARLPGERRLGLLQARGRSRAAALHRERDAGTAGQALADGGAAVADDHRHRGWSHSGRRVEDVLDHGPAGDRMEDLGQL